MPSMSSWRLLGRRLTITLCLLHAAGVLSFLALRALLSPWPPLLTLINSFMPFLFAPLCLTLPLALLTRSRLALFSTLALLAFFVALYGPFFLPRLGPTAAHTGSTLCVMTFNLGPNPAHPERLVAAIANERADVVVVQELTQNTANLLRSELGGRYPYTVLELGTQTTGLLSRYPILESEWFKPAGEGRSALYALLDYDVPLHLMAVHPLPPGLSWYKNSPLPIGLNDAAQQRQLMDVAQRAADLQGPLLVMGDLNTGDQTRAYRRLSTVLNDAYRQAGWGLGFTFPHGLRLGRFPVPGPLLRLDYIFYSDDFYAEWARVACKGGSDHCYLIANLAQVSYD